MSRSLCRAFLLASAGLVTTSLLADFERGRAFLTRPALAADGTVSLDNVSLETGPNTYRFKRIDLVGANLSREEALKLFSGDASPSEAKALLVKLKAQRIAIPETVVTSTDGGRLTFRDFYAEDINEGQVRRVTLAGFDGVSPVESAGKAALKGSALTIDDVDVRHLFPAFKGGDIANGNAKFSRLAWNGFELSFPDKDTPANAPGGNRIKVKFASLSADQTYEGDIPLKSAAALNGLVIELPKASKEGAALAAQGYDKIEMGFRFSGAYDPAQRSYALEDFSIDAANVGSIGLRGKFSGVDKASFVGSKEERLSSLQKADVGALDIRVVNAGVFEKAVAFFAQTENKTPAAVKAEWAAFVAQAGPALLPGEPAASKIGAAIAKFIADPKSLTIALKGKSGPVKIVDLEAIDNPSAILSKIEASAFAEASPNSPAPPARLAAQAPGAAALAPAPGAPAKLSGLAAWSALVGNTIVGKDTGGGALTEYYLSNGEVKQLSEDDASTGKWAAKGAKVCFIFPGEDGETCYKVEVLGDVATFTDDGGNGRRYQILKGNPKGL